MVAHFGKCGFESGSAIFFIQTSEIKGPISNRIVTVVCVELLGGGLQL